MLDSRFPTFDAAISILLRGADAMCGFKFALGFGCTHRSLGAGITLAVLLAASVLQRLGPSFNTLLESRVLFSLSSRWVYKRRFLTHSLLSRWLGHLRGRIVVVIISAVLFSRPWSCTCRWRL